MTFTVWFRKTESKEWTRIENVKGDGILEGYPHRFFILADETRLEVPMSDVVFKFSPERFALIKKQMEREAGQSIPTNDGA